MSLFDDTAGKSAGSAAGGSGGQRLVTSIAEMLSKQQNGLAGLTAAFQQKGLGDIVSSWIGTGQNLPVSASQIQQALGDDQIRSFAQKSGISTQAARTQSADMLPSVVDKLTPGGRLPEGDDLKSASLGLLLNLLSGGKADS